MAKTSEPKEEQWALAGVRKFLLPPRRAGCFSLGPDGRLALACCTFVSVLRTPCIGSGIDTYGGSAAPDFLTFNAQVRSLAEDLVPMTIYPCAVGHEFVCSAAQNEDVICGIEAPGLASSSSASTGKPSIGDVRHVSWAPISHGPAVFVVTGTGRLHVLAPSTVPLANWPRLFRKTRRETETVVSASTPKDLTASFSAADVPSTQNGAPDVGKLPPSSSSVLEVVDNQPDSLRPGENQGELSVRPVSENTGEDACESPGDIKPADSADDSEPGPTPTAPIIVVDNDSGQSPSRAVASEPTDPSPVQETPVSVSGGALLDSEVGSSKKNETVQKPLGKMENWLWQPCGFAQEKVETPTFPPKRATCVESIRLGCEPTVAAAEAGMEDSVVIVAVGAAQGLSLWTWPSTELMIPKFVETLHGDMTSSLAWLSFPSTSGSNGDRYVAYLGVGVDLRVKVYSVVATLTDSGSTLITSELVWSSGYVALGLVSSICWWWEVAKSQPDGKMENESEDEGNGPFFVLKLAVGAMNSTIVFRWISAAQDDALVVADEFSSRGWARKFERIDFVFPDDLGGVAWDTVEVFVSEKSVRHERVITAVNFLVDGRPVSCSEDGRVIAWREDVRVDNVTRGKSLNLIHDCVIADLTSGRPVLGLSMLNHGLCIAISLSVPDTEETVLKTQTQLLGKFRAAARLGRIMIICPVLQDVEDFRGLLKRVISRMVDSAQSGYATLSWDIEMWLRRQSPELIKGALEMVLDTLGHLQEHALGLAQRDAKVCARIFMSLAQLVIRHCGAKDQGSEELISTAEEISAQLVEVLTFFHCCEVIDSALDVLRAHQQKVESPSRSGGSFAGDDGSANGSARDTDFDFSCFSKEEIASLLAISLFALSSSDETPEDEPTDESESSGPLVEARRIVSAIRSSMDPESYKVSCPICELDDEEENALLPNDMETIRGEKVSCSQGDSFHRCALTMLPCRESIVLVCTGCRRTRACGFLSRLVYDRRHDETGERVPFSWLAGQTFCPFCGSSFQMSTITDEMYGTAIP